MFNLVWYATGATGWPIPLKVVFFQGVQFCAIFTDFADLFVISEN